MQELIVHKVNIAHLRLVELTKLANQAKPFYDWIERKSKQVTRSTGSLNDILMTCSAEELTRIIQDCYNPKPSEEKPLLFDGLGRTYDHAKACFYFFAWMIRDAPQQRLAPLISQMRKADNIDALTAQVDTLVKLIMEYRSIVKSFEWTAVKEILIDRLEGSRRSLRGHFAETGIRVGLATALQSYYSAYMNYGKYKSVHIAERQIKVGRHTVDVSATMIDKTTGKPVPLFIPVKTRETQGGGHSHLFSRDIITAVNDIKEIHPNAHIAVVIIAENWSPEEISVILDKIDFVFHFNMNPNVFVTLDEESQRNFNRYIEKVLSNDDQ
ncbi:hypothetical protein [Alicyclobacillus shizuokensis]|uniref:hypothetical protein n=1 Tax=Alicyclobacillus shizuokensis TaxID=392014 RepID=UPI000AD0EB4A|nr:hypothetical protein [Alicyclobacillus shizuokensis]